MSQNHDDPFIAYVKDKNTKELVSNRHFFDIRTGYAFIKKLEEEDKAKGTYIEGRYDLYDDKDQCISDLKLYLTDDFGELISEEPLGKDGRSSVEHAEIIIKGLLEDQAEEMKYDSSYPEVISRNSFDIVDQNHRSVIIK